MSDSRAELFRAIKQLKIELQWAVQTGIEVSSVSSLPTEAQNAESENRPSEWVPVEAGRPMTMEKQEELESSPQSDTPPPAFLPDPPEAPVAEAEHFPPERARRHPASAGRPWERYYESESSGQTPQKTNSELRTPVETTRGKEQFRPVDQRARPDISQTDTTRGEEQFRPVDQRARPDISQTDTTRGKEQFRPVDQRARPDTSQTDTSPQRIELATHVQSLGSASSLNEVRDILGDCTRCKLHKAGRRQIVFGVGNPTSDLMFIGEGPGRQEDLAGEPFVGDAGQLLTRIIERGMGLKRADVYIANIVKCRPPRNRDPEPDEVEACEPFLRAQIRQVQPRVIIALGKYAAQTLLRTKTPISRLRGRWAAYEGIDLMPTYHPAYLLRNPAEKRPVWEDVQAVMRRLGLASER